LPSEVDKARNRDTDWEETNIQIIDIRAHRYTGLSFSFCFFF